MRVGEKVGSMQTAQADPATLARMMVGRELSTPGRSMTAPGEAALSIRGLTAEGDRGIEAVRDVDIEVRESQIVGVAGVAGNGQRELAEVITGLRRSKRGQIHLGGVDITRSSTLERIRLGLGFVPEDRMRTVHGWRATPLRQPGAEGLPAAPAVQGAVGVEEGGRGAGPKA